MFPPPPAFSPSRVVRIALLLTLAALPACGDAGSGSGGEAELRAAPDDPANLTEEELLDRARTLHGRIITVDSHDDIPFDFATEDVNPCRRLDRQVDVPKMREGGLDVAFFIVYVGQAERTPENYERAREQALTKFEAIHRMTEELCPDEIELARTPDDVERIVEGGKLAAAIGIENGFVIGRDLTLLERYDALGANYVTLAHGGHNDIADSSTPRESLGDEASEHGGVSPFGEEVIAEMNRLGIMVDVSHVSKAAALDAMRLSTVPVIASHSSVRALADHPRNMDDETLRALAENGGVIHIVALGAYVDVPPPEKAEALRALREEVMRSSRDGQGGSAEFRREVDRRRAEIEERWPGPGVADFVDHIDYAVDLIGIDHVGISSDFDGGGGVTGWEDAGETHNVTAELIRRGYTDEEIGKLWGGNLLRVWREVEEAATGSSSAGAG